MFTWNNFLQALKQESIEFEHLKVIQLAQAILESGRGQSEIFKLHANPFGMKFRKEMRDIADQVIYTDSAGERDIYCKFDDFEAAVKGYWVFIDRPAYSGWRTSNSTPEDYIRFISYGGYVGGAFDGSERDRKIKEAYIKKVIDLIPQAQSNLGVSSPAATPSAPKIWKGKRVLLEVGHGPNPDGFEPGAVGVGGVGEYDLNWIAAKAAQDLILKAGVPCTITDFGDVHSPSDLCEIGKTAPGYDVFFSIHHNSAESPAQGSEVLGHDTKGDADDLALAKLMSAEIAKELGIPDRIAKGKDPRQGLGVLSGAEDTNVGVSVLPELDLIHVPVAEPNYWSQRGGKALARAILRWLEAN